MDFLVDLFLRSAVLFLIPYLLTEICYMMTKDDHIKQKKNHSYEKKGPNSDGARSVCQKSSKRIKKIVTSASGEVCGKEESTGSVLESNETNGNGGVCEESSNFLEKLETFDNRESGLEMGGGDVGKEESTGLVLESKETNGNGKLCKESSNFLEKLEAFDTREGCLEIGIGDIGKEESFREEELGEDWEGIERSEMERVFGKAVAFVGSKDNADKVYGLGSKVKLRLYGLHKTAIEGPCVKARPFTFKVSARAKWNAWKQLGNMSQEDAMEQYIILLSECCPEWIKNHNKEDGKQVSAHMVESSKPPSNVNTSPSGQLGSVDERAIDGEDSSSYWVEPKAFIPASNCLQ